MELLTSGVIAAKLNVNRDRVSYALRRLAVKPAGFAGHVRLFHPDILAAVQMYLNVAGNGDLRKGGTTNG